MTHGTSYMQQWQRDEIAKADGLNATQRRIIRNEAVRALVAADDRRRAEREAEHEHRALVGYTGGV